MAVRAWLVVCGMAVCVTIAGAAPGRAAGRSGGDAAVVIDFGGGGDEVYAGSPGADINYASVEMSWHLQWRLPSSVAYSSTLSQPVTAEDIAGTSSIDWGRPNTPGCSGPVKANTTVVGKENFNGRPNSRIALPNPMIIGFAAEPCWAYGGGGTGWFAIRGNSNQAIEQQIDDEIAFTTIPTSDLERPSFSCPPPARFSMTYPNPVGSGTHTITVRWWGMVRVTVNGKGPSQPPRDSPCGYSRAEQMGDEIIGAVGPPAPENPRRPEDKKSSSFGIIDENGVITEPLPPPTKAFQSLLLPGPITVKINSGPVLIGKGTAIVGKSATLKVRLTRAGRKALQRPLAKPINLAVTVTYAGTTLRKTTRITH